MNKILVVGSSNTDLIARVKQFPAAGETIEGIHYLQAMGGKGANQAFAAHKLGGEVKFITSLGDDANGKNTMSYYQKEGLDVTASQIVNNISSGTAMIWVDENGQNCIVITPGANKELSPEYILKVKGEIAGTDLVLLQMEIPYETVKFVCELAHQQNKKVMLNAAPARPLDSDLIKMIDILVVNETEAETISGVKIDQIGEEAVADKLLELGAKNIVLTLGQKGCLFKNYEQLLFIPAFHVKAVDSTAAGDTFCGALATELSHGKSWEEALKFATASAAICVTRLGAQPSIPDEKEVREFLIKNIITV